MTELFDTAAERAAVQILWEESTTFGFKRGRQLLARVGLEREDFTDEPSAILFSRIQDAVTNELAPTLGGFDEEVLPRLREVLNPDELVNPETLDAHCERIRDLSTRRNVKRFARELVTKAQDPSVSISDVLSFAGTASRRIPTRFSSWVPLTETMKRVEQHLHDVSDGRKRPTVLTGFSEIDEETGGLPATLVVIAAMPGVGKSAFVASIIREMAKRGEKAAIFCMEDESEWLAFRLLAHDSGVHQFVLRNRKLTAVQWEQAGNTFHQLAGFNRNILCDDRKMLRPADVLFAARNAVMRHGARAVFLDNMTAMQWERGARMDLEIQDFLSAARALANELEVPFVVLSHVKRREGLDVGDMPRLTDCAETSAFEKLCRMGYGLCRQKKGDTLVVGVLKNTNGRAFIKFDLQLRPASALIEAELRKAKQERLFEEPAP